MEPERKKPGGFPPKTEQKPYSVHAAIRKGIAVFFCSTGFFLFPGPYPSSGKSRQPSACTFWCARFFFVGKCKFLLFPDRTSLPRCRGPPSVWISSRNSDETEVHSVDAGKKEYGCVANLSRSRMRCMTLIYGATGKCATLRMI